MKKTIIAASLLLAMSANLYAQDKNEGYQFTPVKELKVTPVKNQNRTGTCWCFSTLSFLESELIRMGKGEQDLSEMFVVSYAYKDKAEKYVRLHGYLNFAQGGSFIDPLYVWKKYGIVPEEVMKGLNYGETMHVHGEMESAAAEYLKAIVKNPNRKLTTAWKQGFDGIIDAYLGQAPQTFTYQGKEYTPLSFAASLGLNADDYVSITSYTHHPFYTQFALEVPDNWRMDQMYNVPMEDMMRIIDHALAQGYTLAWGADVSEVGFTRKGIGVMPDADKGADLTGSDMAHWLGLSEADKREELTKKPLPEMVITQEMRQQAFDSWENTDDHGMQIFGVAKDQNGKRYYMVKNSWGTQKSDYKGIWYVSEAFMQYKTNDVLLHKDALPKDIRKRLAL